MRMYRSYNTQQLGTQDETRLVMIDRLSQKPFLFAKRDILIKRDKSNGQHTINY